MKTSELFIKELSYIKNDTLRKIVIDTLDASPKCIQVIPASSSKKYHPEYAVIIGKENNDGSVEIGGLMRHVKAAVGIAHCQIETDIFECIALESYTQNEREMYADCAYASLILHDCCKPDDTPKHGTRFDHPLLAAKLFKDIATKYITKENLEYMKTVIPLIYKAIASHMGQFNTAPYAKGITLPRPETAFEWFVHQCDYLASRKFLIFDFDVYNEVKR